MKTGDEALARMLDPASQVSAHYMIDEDGAVTQLVDESKRAWHAGKSFWQGVTDINSASIGIELVNPGHEFGYRDFPKKQITALVELLGGITKRHSGIGRTGILAHSDIAPNRKQDPGELFPWAELAEQGFGIWPYITALDEASASDGEVWEMLQNIGYTCDDDTALSSALMTFQRHYYPDHLTGLPDRYTIAKIRAVLAEYMRNRS
jgi:N-acetylmuramoyl-L-alanine amidase